ncbi:MAG: DNA replication/repair protein RecF [Sandaracinus sp.]|nr:DNA replication/repair protein RecF [Sandaracinus sp.]MCB9619125.1 DNA replication/repair protein RecF [Sandaracinus sp.]MCB9632708.1 DNA replication/repair protein RecF [Sandaracinus sp.]
MTPLRVERLFTRGFRNLGTTTLDPGPHFNVVHGDNGAGKSNLLEAIHYLGALKSFRGARSEDLIGVEEDKALLQARVSGESFGRTLKVLLARSEARKLALDDKRPRSTAHWLLAVPMVLFHPGDAGLAMGPPEPRRAYLDRILEQMDATYGATLASYGKALRSRNRLLKMEDVDRRSVTAYDAVLAQAGAIVGQTRARLVEDLAPRAERAFVEVAGVELPLEVRYEPRVTPDPESLAAALAKSYEKDRARGFTAEGPHADELALRVRRSSDAVAAKHHASQGQHRAIVLALKVAELDVLAARVQRVPILLLDDVSSELDRSRNRRLFELLQRLGGQVFLTTTHAEFILLEEQRVDFRVEAGVVRRFEG